MKLNDETPRRPAAEASLPSGHSGSPAAISMLGPPLAPPQASATACCVASPARATLGRLLDALDLAGPEGAPAVWPLEPAAEATMRTSSFAVAPLRTTRNRVPVIELGALHDGGKIVSPSGPPLRLSILTPIMRGNGCAVYPARFDADGCARLAAVKLHTTHAVSEAVAVALLPTLRRLACEINAQPPGGPSRDDWLLLPMGRTPHSGLRNLFFGHVAQTRGRAVRAVMAQALFASVHPIAACDMHDMFWDHPLADADVPRLGRALAHTMLQQLEGMHARGIVHNDVKLENILVWEDGGLSLEDFGVSFLTRDTPSDGTPIYMAPEAFLDRRSLQPSRRDIFSVGAVLLDVLSATTGGLAYKFEPSDEGLMTFQAMRAHFRGARRCYTADYARIVDALGAPAGSADDARRLTGHSALALAALRRAQQRAPALMPLLLALLRPNEINRPSALEAQRLLSHSGDVQGDLHWMRHWLGTRARPLMAQHRVQVLNQGAPRAARPGQAPQGAARPQLLPWVPPTNMAKDATERLVALGQLAALGRAQSAALRDPASRKVASAVPLAPIDLVHLFDDKGRFDPGRVQRAAQALLCHKDRLLHAFEPPQRPLPPHMQRSCGLRAPARPRRGWTSAPRPVLFVPSPLRELACDAATLQAAAAAARAQSGGHGAPLVDTLSVEAPSWDEAESSFGSGSDLESIASGTWSPGALSSDEDEL